MLWCLSEKDAATFYHEYNELYSTRYSADAFGYSELKLTLAKCQDEIRPGERRTIGVTI